MWQEDFNKWLDATGYSTINDWGYQRISGWDYFWIINPKTDRFALIKTISNFNGSYYEVIVQDWVDHGSWADTFHKETKGVYK